MISVHPALTLVLVVGLLSPAHRLGAQDVAPASTAARRDAADPGEPVLLLESHLWRNFQPSTGALDSSLTAKLRVRTADRRPLPRGTRVERARVTAGGRSWTVAVRPEDVTLDDGALELIVRGGPAWPVGTQVDVLVVVRDANGRTRRLLTRAQAIRRLD